MSRGAIILVLLDLHDSFETMTKYTQYTVIQTVADNDGLWLFEGKLGVSPYWIRPHPVFQSTGAGSYIQSALEKHNFDSGTISLAVTQTWPGETPHAG